MIANLTTHSEALGFRQRRDGILIGRTGTDDTIDVEPWRIYNVDDAREFLTETGIDVDAMSPAVDGKFASAFVRARKP